jgi:beta-galactosidase
LKEIGANSIRLSHYPQAPYFMDLLDENGIVTWTEIPFVGPGGYADVGFINQPTFRENGKQQLIEMIRQNFNRPSICFWGLFNELKPDGDNPVEFLNELNTIVKLEDPTRLTTAASCVDENELNEISDLICWNKYFGWYGDDVKQIGKWADETHKNHPDFKIGISEYGAGGSIYQHEEKLKQPVPGSKWHQEAWQAFFHEQNWKELSIRSYIWGTFIWNLFDFGASHRSEGDRSGKNDKGLVTFDRKTKKDAFYFYKANWNLEPMLYIADRRYVDRSSRTTILKGYSNLKEVELFINGSSFGKRKPNEYHIIYWENVNLQSGKNHIEIKGENGKHILYDSCEWMVG